MRLTLPFTNNGTLGSSMHKCQTAEYGIAQPDIMTAKIYLSPEFAHLSLKLCNI